MSSSPNRPSSPAARPQQGAARVAAIQMVSGTEVADNLAEAERLVAQAAERGAVLAALPEHFALIGRRDTDKLAVAETMGSGPIQERMASWAMRHRIWLVGGSIPIRGDDPARVRNTTLVFDDRGKVMARYDKMHLFGLDLGSERFDESDTIEPGDRIVVVETPVGRLGVSICYDVRFPELFRAMGTVDAILLPSAFTRSTGEAHWETLLRARAIENLTYVIAPAQGGRHASGRTTHGNTMIVDPWGVVLERVVEGPGMALADIDSERLAEVRRNLPALSHRRSLLQADSIGTTTTPNTAVH